MSTRKSFLSLWRNPVSLAGIWIAVLGLALAATLTVYDTLKGGESVYLGLLTFLILPGVVAVGCAVILVGMLRERHRVAEGAEPHPLPSLDLNTPRGMRTLSLLVAAGTFTLLMVAALAYEVYHYTESVRFCGELCHGVMAPEYVAFQRSPHARVTCADCHIGAGAGWYVRSKLSGVRQIFATLLGTYSRPIPTPIENLRPARETCETCHWPAKFFGAKLFVSPRFAYDPANTPRTLSMLLLIGGGQADQRKGGGGIHWHMLMQNKVTFQPADERQQVIAKVWTEKAGGSKVEYALQGGDRGGEGGEGRILTMDCVSCHNRPTHIFLSPEVNVDAALLEGKINPALPGVKRRAVELLTGPYPDLPEALKGIREGMMASYGKGASAEVVEKSIAALEAIYRSNFFPEMRTDWRSHNNNIGHRDDPGCFRCHDGRHVSGEGKVITRACDACHTLPTLGPLQAWTAGYPTGTASWHPLPLGGRHALLNCDRCHDGGMPRASTCIGCHQHPASAPMSDLTCDSCHLKDQEALPQSDCRDCHDHLGGLHRKTAGHLEEACISCHPPHSWKPSERETCLGCHEDKVEHKPKQACVYCHRFRSGG